MVNRLSVAVLMGVSLCGMASTAVYAVTEEQCKIEVAVARPPVPLDQNVAFNVTNGMTGFSKSITVKANQAGPVSIDNIPCTGDQGGLRYTVSATAYVSGDVKSVSSIGQYILKAGDVSLTYPGNSVSVVFPLDFINNGNQ